MTSNSEEIFSFIDKYGVINKDALNNKKKNLTKKKVSHKRRSSREQVDLHGLRAEEAAIRLRIAVNSCIDRGVKELLVIHGIGYHSHNQTGPVLKQMVRKKLESEFCNYIRDFKTALPKDGGDGATLIYFR